MENLINVKNENGKLLVSARELYNKLILNEGKTERFSQWFNRHLQYGFIEGEDFTSVKKFTVVNNGANRELQDYAITINMAKELCMLQRSEIGKQFRLYFIECEKQLQQIHQPSYQIQDPIERAKAWIKEEEQRQEQQRLLEEQQPKVEAYNEYMNSDGTYTVTNACRMLKKNRTKVFKKLRELELICKKETKPTKKGIDKGYFKVVIKGTMDCLVVTSQGIEFIRELEI